MNKLLYPKPVKEEKHYRYNSTIPVKIGKNAHKTGKKASKSKKRSKLPTIKKLKKELDKLMSQIVILRDGGCVVCGSKNNLTCGHLFTRSHMATRWELLNCHCQCRNCNFKHEFDPQPYNEWFIREYGLERWTELHDQFSTIRKWTRADLEQLKEKLEELLKGFL